MLHEILTTVTFDYGTTTVYGQTISAIPDQVTGNIATSVSAVLTGLTPGLNVSFQSQRQSIHLEQHMAAT